MPRTTLRLFSLVGAALVAIACSSGDSGGTKTDNKGTGGTTNNPGTGGSGTPSGGGECTTDIKTDSTSATDACKKWCVAEDSCDSTTTIEQCEGYNKCANHDKETLEACKAAIKAQYDCQRSQTGKICGAEDCCSTARDAVATACNP